MSQDDVSETITDMRAEVIDELVKRHIPEQAYAEQWNTTGLKEEVQQIFGLDLPIAEWAAEEGIADQEIKERIVKEADAKAAKKAVDIGTDNWRQLEKAVLLHTLDQLWREHIVTLDHLRQVIGFRAYGQRDPLNEYKSEAFSLFEILLAKLREAMTGQLMHVELAPLDEQPAMQPVELPQMQGHHIDPTTGLDEMAMADAALAAGRGEGSMLGVRQPSQGRKSAELNPNDPSTWGKVSRNNACPCGSGKKYKHCHGQHG